MNTQVSTNSFEIIVQVDSNDIDQNAHVNNVVYLRWIQEVALAHWKTVATPKQQSEISWIVIRHEIDYKYPAKINDFIVLQTWFVPLTTVKFERHTEIFRKTDYKLLASGKSQWCPIDIKSEKLLKDQDDLRKRLFDLNKTNETHSVNR